MGLQISFECLFYLLKIFIYWLILLNLGNFGGFCNFHCWLTLIFAFHFIHKCLCLLNFSLMLLFRSCYYRFALFDSFLNFCQFFIISHILKFLHGCFCELFFGVNDIFNRRSHWTVSGLISQDWLVLSHVEPNILWLFILHRSLFYLSFNG